MIKRPIKYKVDFEREVARKQARKIKARQQKDRGLWYGLGMFGIVGWSVMIPFMIFLALGIFIDVRWPGRISWTLTFLVIGISVGCLNAWFWVSRERKKIEKDDRSE